MCDRPALANYTKSIHSPASGDERDLKNDWSGSAQQFKVIRKKTGADRRKTGRKEIEKRLETSHFQATHNFGALLIIQDHVSQEPLIFSTFSDPGA